MTGKTITIWFLLSSLLLWLLYDIYAIANKWANDSISAVTLYYSCRVLLIPLLAGILCGHLFFPKPSSPLFDEPSMIYPGLVFLGAIAMGALFWPQVAR